MVAVNEKLKPQQKDLETQVDLSNTPDLLEQDVTAKEKTATRNSARNQEIEVAKQVKKSRQSIVPRGGQ